MMWSTSGIDAKIANYSFSALVMSALTWTLLELFVVIVHGNLKAHLFSAAFTLPLFVIAVRRCQLHFPKPTDGTPDVLRRAIGSLVNPWSVIFLLLGLAISWIALQGSALVTSIIAGLFSLIPWARTSLARSSYLAAFLAVMFGVLISLFTVDLRAWPIGFILSAIAASLIGGAMMFLAIAQAVLAKPKAEETEPRPVEVV